MTISATVTLKQMKLIQFTPFPPGSFPYSQTFKGVTYNWIDEGLDIESQAARILKFRRANGVPRASFDETLEDLNIFTCARLGNDPRWCGDSTKNHPLPQKASSGGCKGCGAHL